MTGTKKSDRIYTGILCLLVLLLFTAVELEHPYFFFQDDNRNYFYPHIVHSVRSVLNGELALFNFHQYLGTAKLACSEPAVLYPPYYLGYLLSQVFTGDSYATMECIALLHLILAAAGFYRLMRCFDLEPVASLYGGIAWAFSAVVMIIGNSWMHYTVYAAFLPWVFLYAVRYCRTGSYAGFMSLAVLRGVTCTLGQPQLFAYMVVFEIILAVGWLVSVDNKRSTQPPVHDSSRQNDGSRLKVLSGYLLSFPVSLALAAPIILPTLHQAAISAKRSTVLEWGEYVSLSYDLKLWLHGLISPLAPILDNDWTGQGLLSHIGYPAVVFMVIAWFRYRQNRAFVLFLTVVALFALLWSSNTFVTGLIYHVPVFNKFRWPFRLAYFTSFFLIMVATFGCNHLLSAIGRHNSVRWKAAVCSAAVILIQVVNILVLYNISPQPMFSRHFDRIPFSEPLKELLSNGRIVTVGVVPPEEGGKVIHGYSLPHLGFNYATLWGLHHFAGYEVLVAEENFRTALKIEYNSVCNVMPGSTVNIPEIAPLDYFRSWGVRWYIVDSSLPFVETEQLKLVYSDKFRNVLQDSAARPLVAWPDAYGAVQFQFKTNSIEVQSDRETAGTLQVNVLYNPYFSVSIDGRPVLLTRTDDGQMEVAVPGGSHAIEIRYHDRDFNKGILISLATLTVLLTCGYVLKRCRACHGRGYPFAFLLH